MQKLIMTALLLGSLTACATPNGNYTALSDSYNARIADDTAQKLVALYPPASTRFILSQDMTDAYGIELVKKLRENGYAVKDEGGLSDLLNFKPPAILTPTSKPDLSKNGKSEKKAVSVPSAKAKIPEVTASSSKSIGYIVDQVGEKLYRLTVNVDSESLSRVYVLSGKKGIAPAGSWTRRQ